MLPESELLKKPKLMGQRAVAKDFHQGILAYQTRCAKIFHSYFLYLGSLGQRLESVEIDGLIFHTVDVLEAKLGHTALQRHLTAFKTDLTLVAGTRFSTLVTTR